MTTSNSRVAITVPMSLTPELGASERISVRQLEHYLGDYDRYLVLPEGVDFSLPGFGNKFFERKYFGSARAHTRLMLSREFYTAFGQYEFILNYHLDSLVFSNQMEEWCARGYDYVGPPWIQCPELPWVTTEHVGNGGFSLRKVSSFLQVLESKRYWVEPETYWEEFCGRNGRLRRFIGLPRKYLCRLRRFNNVDRHIARDFVEAGENEDRFWSHEAHRYLESFTVPPVDLALLFAFEAAPRDCFERVGRKLPFGCHAWERYDKEFYEPFLLKA